AELGYNDIPGTGSGWVNVNANSLFDVTGILYVGFRGNGGIVNVSGANARLTVGSSVSVGHDSNFYQGQLNITNGGYANVGSVSLNGNTGGRGTLTVSGSGSQLVASAIAVGGTGATLPAATVSS